MLVGGRARSSSGQHQQHRIMHCGLRADLLRCDGCREAGPAGPQHSRVHDSVSKGCTVALAEPPQKKQSGRSNDWGDEEQSVFLSPRRRGCQAAQQPGAAGAAGMASVQYDNSAFYLLVLALLCMYLASASFGANQSTHVRWLRQDAAFLNTAAARTDRRS